MKAFISYSHRDELLLERLHVHLAMLRRDGGISDWYDREIRAGGTIEREILDQLNNCDLFLALVSPDFLNSGYCYEREMNRAIQRHEASELVIVPVILEPCDWRTSPLNQFKAIPKDGKPVSEWANQNTAFLDVVTELRRLAAAQRFAEDQPVVMAPQAAEQPRSNIKYRVKRSFDDIDRNDFRRNTYRVIREYFEINVAEINGVEGIRARNEDIGPLAFTCMILNQLRNERAQAAITVRASPSASAFRVMGDVYYSFQAHAPDNVANGGFTVETDDYELFLRPNAFNSAGKTRKWTPNEAAHRLWEELLENAGVSYK